jgi:beta-glucosidase
VTKLRKRDLYYSIGSSRRRKLNRAIGRCQLSRVGASAAILVGLASLFIACCLTSVFAQYPERPVTGPWMDKTKSPDERADLLIAEMTMDEKIVLLHGVGGSDKSLGGAGYVPGVPRLGIPDLQMTDGRSGVANAGFEGKYTTALPSAIANAASWDLKSAYEYGAQLGREVHVLGFNVSLGGTANLIRDPRNGRNFECLGEDPLLIGKMLGQELKGTQDQGVIGNINRYVANDQETGRMVGNVVIDKRALQETDMLAFKIAIEESNVGTVMCAYNQLNGVYECQNSYTLGVLKNDWGFKGWVMSDWGATHAAEEGALAGQDQEMQTGRFFNEQLAAAVQAGSVPQSRIDDMVHRILRTEFAVGVFDNRVEPAPVDPFAGAEQAQKLAERGIVLLKNSGGQMPVDTRRVRSIAVIGSHADVGVLSGGGSDQIDAAGGNAVPPPPGQFGRGFARVPVYHHSSPLNAIRARAPHANVQYDPGTDPAAAAKLAGNADVAIVFVSQPTTEGADVPSISLPDRQDDLVSKVAAANRHTIVVLETGGPASMPWIDQVSGVLEAWYPGIRGAEAITEILFGDVNPSAKLPVTFAKSEADLPYPQVFGATLEPLPDPFARGGRGRGNLPPFDIEYSDALKVGYRWFDAEKKTPLFPFGFGLSYTSYTYSSLKVIPGAKPTVSFRVTNRGPRAGEEVAEVYVALPDAAGEPFKRLVGWEKIQLAAGETKPVSLALAPEYMSVFDVDQNAWEVVPGEYKVYVGGSSRDLPLNGTVNLSTP